MDYRLVYDISNAGPSMIGTGFFLLGAIVTTVTAVLVFRRDPAVQTTAGSKKPHPGRKKPWSIFLFACVFTLVALGLMYGDRGSLVEVAKRGECKLLSGTIAGFIRMSGGKGSQESFTVGGVQFAYSDFQTTGAFNHSARYGGPIGPDLAVRICYTPSKRTGDNLILRLEVAS